MLFPTLVSTLLPDIVPLRVKLYVPPIAASDIKTILPLSVAAVEFELTITPCPVQQPYKLRLFAMVCPFKSNFPPLTVTVPVPSGPAVIAFDATVVLAATLRMLAEIVVPPVKLLGPERT